MSWRTVVIAKRCKLDLKLGYLVREFDREKLFFLVNLRSWYPDETVELFLQSALGHGHKIMLIDSCDYPRLPSERRVTVDIDLCEF